MASTATSYLPDDEEERRRAEVEALVGGFGADLAAGMRAGGIDIDAPQPGDPRGEQPSPMAHADAPMPQRAPMPVAPTASMARGVTQQAAPAPAQRLTPRQELPQLPPDMSRTYQQQIDDLDGQQRREQRRRGIIGSILGLIGGGRGGSQFVDGFVNQHAGAYDQRRQRVAQMMAANQEQRAQAERARAEMRQRAVQQGNADRDYELRRSGQALIDADRDAMRAQQREIFGLREAQDLQQDASRFAAADQRSRRHANAIRPGAGGRAVDPPDPNALPATADDVERQIDELRAINDIGVTEIEAYLQQRAGVDTTSEEGRRRLLAVLAQNRRHLEDPDSRQAGAFWDNIRTSEGTGLRTANTEAAATAALSDQARGFGEAADALEEMQRQLGPIGSRLARSEGFMGAATAAMGGPEVEAARAAFRDTLSNLLHERGGASLTPAEKQIIEDALASGSFITSPEATVRQLRAIQRRLEQRRADRSVRPRSAPAASAEQPAASGRYRAGQVITGPGGQRVTLTQEQADRLNARGQ